MNSSVVDIMQRSVADLGVLAHRGTRGCPSVRCRTDLAAVCEHPQDLG
jgi:hypothetical protein